MDNANRLKFNTCNQIFDHSVRIIFCVYKLYCVLLCCMFFSKIYILENSCSLIFAYKKVYDCVCIQVALWKINKIVSYTKLYSRTICYYSRYMKKYYTMYPCVLSVCVPTTYIHSLARCLAWPLKLCV